MARFLPRNSFFQALNSPVRTRVVFIASHPGGFISSSCASYYRRVAEFSGLAGQRGVWAGGLGCPSGSNSSVRVKGRRDRFFFVPLVATRGEPFLVAQLRATHPLARYYTTLHSTPTMSEAKKVCIVGSGNWGSAIAKIVGHNVQTFEQFDNTVKMWVFEELINGRKLTEIINETHENVKYLPNHILPANIVAVPDVVEAAQDADVLIFVLPHQFIGKICDQLVGKIKPSAIGLSLIKGFVPAENGGIELISRIINKKLSIPMSVLMGANLAPEVADEKFCETTIGSRDKQQGVLLRDLIQTNYFRVVVVDDVETVEMCGALKNIVACGAGFVDGLGYGDNTKAAVIRLGLMEMIKFAEVFYPGSRMSTFFESCGVADLITTCYGGRNRRVSEAFVKTRKSIEELEKEMLNGQQLQGPHTADEVNFMLKNQNMEDRFPLFTAIHLICKGKLSPEQMIDCIRNHPEHIVKNEDNDKRSKL